MIQSRRRILSTIGAAAGIAAVCGVSVPLLAQRPVPPPRPSPNAPKNENAPMGMENPPAEPTVRQSDLNRQLQAAIKVEVDKLCQMANELKEDMTRINPGETLSVSFVKKAQAIEKLARQIKDQAKG